jgi:hypothetical protein
MPVGLGDAAIPYITSEFNFEQTAAVSRCSLPNYGDVPHGRKRRSRATVRQRPGPRKAASVGGVVQELEALSSFPQFRSRPMAVRHSVRAGFNPVAGFESGSGRI